VKKLTDVTLLFPEFLRYSNFRNPKTAM